MAEKYDAYDYSYRNQKKDDIYDMPSGNGEDRAFSSMAEFNERFADLFKGRENSYNLNGDIYFKGKKVLNAAEYVPDTKKETINKKGKVKSTRKKKSGLGFIVFLVFFFNIFGGFIKGLDSQDMAKLKDIVRDVVREVFEIDLPEDTEVDKTNETVDTADTDDKGSNTISAEYKSVKAKLAMPRAETVDVPGAMNVCGTTFTIGMTAKEVENLGLEYEEYRNNETGELERIHVKYTDGKDSDDMVVCYVNPAENGNKDNLEDYRVSSFYSSYWYAYEQNMQVYYNAKVIYGIETDMTFDEVKKIVNNSPVDDFTIYAEGDYPSVMFQIDDVFYIIMTDNGIVSQISVEKY